MRPAAWLALCVLSACSASDDAYAPVSNPGFESKQCDEGSLCDWTVEGQISSVPTWHEEDHGTELLDQNTSIAQLIAPFDGGPCVRFKLIADVAASANVIITLDFEADGNVEYTDVIPAAHWTLLTYQHPVPAMASSLRIRIEKQSLGRAVLARLDLTAGSCDAEP